MQRLKSDLHCPFDKHDQSLIVGVCVNEQCPDKRPFCVACQFQFHSSHQKDLKRFDDFKNLLSENSQLTEKLKSHLNDLQQLVKFITHLIEATQYRNNHQILLEMNYTDLHDSINQLITQWNQQRNLCELLKDIFSTTVKDKIKTLQLQVQKKPNDVRTKSNYLKTETDVLQTKDQLLDLPSPQNINLSKVSNKLADPTINITRNRNSIEIVEGIILKENSQNSQDSQKLSQLQNRYFHPNPISKQKHRSQYNVDQTSNKSKYISENNLDKSLEQLEMRHSNSFAFVNVLDQLSNISKRTQISDKKSANAIKIHQIN
ncbi:unnamed protein product (macronuclear) [Paramecium tetraurelia]|uniref:B box-type domain-containing protein n=1 Tax=Paramecium tetraurelia TaxID=5888 RepID=A0DUP8_PARTE|nr:uncharacterized protein GSPATT00020437001 [Paramecium tetraurelia]CAK86765.1 unnamed protein product [Paramecium tetraurelia]|eukprot:XP_001454162.1 hypothetical protein (macronuclear) [Paramecium tetraurelia strain d4-2]